MCVRNGSRNLVGKTALISQRYAGLAWGAFMNILRPHKNNTFLYFFLNTRFFRNQIDADLDTATVKQITIGTLNGVEISIPHELEQEKIATFLSFIDDRITKQRELVEKLKTYKRGALSALFSRKIRFKNGANYFPTWNKSSIGDIFSERCERATGSEQLLAVTINSGIIKRDEIDLKDNSSEDKGNYKRVYSGDIAYNTMRMWQGASGVSCYDGIVSPAYTVIFPIKKNKTDVRFWGYYFKTYNLICEFQRYSQGLTSDTWNLKFPQLSDIEIFVPCFEEQKLIADFLDKLEETVDKHTNILNVYVRHKNELLRQMFI